MDWRWGRVLLLPMSIEEVGDNINSIIQTKEENRLD